MWMIAGGDAFYLVALLLAEGPGDSLLGLCNGHSTRRFFTTEKVSVFGKDNRAGDYVVDDLQD